MAVFNIRPFSTSCGVPPRKKLIDDRNPSIIDSLPRQPVSGWSQASSSRNMNFLSSILTSQLTGAGYFVTLTLPHAPSTHLDWHALRTAYFKRLKRRGLIRLHWVTEWTARKVPHFHIIVFMPEDFPAGELTSIWLSLTFKRGFNTSSAAQDIKEIQNFSHLIEYHAKHGSRGSVHYQRASSNIPPAWNSLTGNVWGHWGDWPIAEPVTFEAHISTFHIYRRMIRNWRIADARARLDAVGPLPLVRARRMLQFSDIGRCTIRGLREWTPDHVTLKILQYLQSQGFSLTIK